MRPSFLVDVSSTESREGQTGNGVGHMTNINDHDATHSADHVRLEDDPDDFDDDDSDLDEDDDEQDDDDDDGEEEDEDTETWQVTFLAPSR
jgi:hypothetical protein